MKVLADAADKSYFVKLVKMLRMDPMSVRVSELGFAGLSPLDAKRVARIIDDYVTSQGPVIFNVDKIDIKKVAGFYLSRAEYVDEDDDAGLSVIVADSEGNTMVNVYQWEY